MRGTRVKIQECYHEVRQDDQRKSICASDFTEEHGLHEADHRAS